MIQGPAPTHANHCWMCLQDRHSQTPSCKTVRCDTERPSLSYRLLLLSSQRLLMEKEPILPYAERSLRLAFQKFWSAEDTQTACNGVVHCSVCCTGPFSACFASAPSKPAATYRKMSLSMVTFGWTKLASLSEGLGWGCD